MAADDTNLLVAIAPRWRKAIHFRIRAEVFGSEPNCVLITIDLFGSNIGDQALDALGMLFTHWLCPPGTIIVIALLNQLV